MSLKTTKSEVIRNYPVIISTGYCNLQELLRFETPVAHTEGIYGWNADIYHFGYVAICTGYRPFGTVSPSYDIIKEYEKTAKEINNESKTAYEDKKKRIENLIADFIGEMKAVK